MQQLRSEKPVGMRAKAWLSSVLLPTPPPYSQQDPENRVEITAIPAQDLYVFLFRTGNDVGIASAPCLVSPLFPGAKLHHCIACIYSS